MTNKQQTAVPLPLRLLGVILIFFAFRDYLSISATYGTLRAAGISHADIWNFSAYPREASLYMFQHFVVGVEVLSLVALWSRNKYFPWLFTAYYGCLVTIDVATWLLLNSPTAIGGIIGHSILCVPWLVYVFKSQQARNVFRDSTPCYLS
jgi:hypothetical protein